MSATGSATRNDLEKLIPAPSFEEPRAVVAHGTFHIDMLLNAVEHGFGIGVEVKGYGGDDLLGGLQQGATPARPSHSPEYLRALADYARHGFADFLEECANRWEELGDGSQAIAALRAREAEERNGEATK